jgi:hypothetical protein
VKNAPYGRIEPGVLAAIMTKWRNAPMTALVYVAVASFADNETGLCYPSLKAIWERLGRAISQRGIERALVRLRCPGVLNITYRPGRSTVYEVVSGPPLPLTARVSGVEGKRPLTARVSPPPLTARMSPPPDSQGVGGTAVVTAEKKDCSLSRETVSRKTADRVSEPVSQKPKSSNSGNGKRRKEDVPPYLADLALEILGEAWWTTVRQWLRHPYTAKDMVKGLEKAETYRAGNKAAYATTVIEGLAEDRAKEKQKQKERLDRWKDYPK